MPLPDVSARRPIGVAMAYVCVVVLGVVSARKLAVDLMPEVDMPQVSVTTTYEGVAPEEIESLITRPIEQALSTVQGIDRLASTSSEGLSRVQALFTWGRNLDEAVNDIREQLDRVQGALPEDAEQPAIFRFNLSDMPVAFLGLSGSGDARRLRYLADEVLSRRLERVVGVASVDVRGGREREIQVQLDASRLAALGISPRQVSQALQRENRNVAAGDMLETGKEVLIRTVGELKTAEDVAATIVTSREGRPIFVRDMGTVLDTFREVTNELWIDGTPGMRLFVSKQSGANTVEVVGRLRQEIEAINREYEGRLHLAVLFDGSLFIRQAVDNVKSSAAYGAGLAILVLFIFLRDWRSTLIISTAIPISILATVALMYFCGFTLNVVSLGGIALGIGTLVDSAIVALENIYQRRQDGLPALQAAIVGTRQVSLSIIAGALTTMAAFVPVVFISGFAGVFFRELAVVVSFAQLPALLVALTLIPAAAARFLSPRVETHAKGAGPLVLFLDRIGGWLHALEEAYGRLVAQALRHPGRVIGWSLAILVGSLLLFPLVGFELMPESDEGRINLSAELPIGTPVETTMHTMEELELRVRSAMRAGELEHLVTTAGPENWWRPASGNQGSMEIMLAPVSQRARSVDEIAAAMRDGTANLPGAEIRLFPSSSNMMMRMMRGGMNTRLAVEIRGHDLATADRLAERVEKLLAGVPGVVHPRTDRELGQMERSLHIDRSRLAELGITGSDVADAVEHYVLGRVSTRLREGGDEHDIRIQLRPENRAQVEQLDELPIITSRGEVVRLGAVATVASGRGPTSIGRENQQRILRVGAGIEGRNYGDVTGDVLAALANLEVPEGFSVNLGGELEEQGKVFLDLLIGIALAMFLVFTVMAIQFESLVQPLVIMTAVPFSLVGMMLALTITGTTFNMNSFLGLIVLVGVVVNNAIVLVDYVNQLRREEGVPLYEALVTAGRRRLRPILMTALATVLALIPLALGIGEGAELQAPLARVMIGGLSTSTLITLVFVPALYLIIERRRARATVGAVEADGVYGGEADGLLEEVEELIEAQAWPND